MTESDIEQWFSRELKNKETGVKIKEIEMYNSIDLTFKCLVCPCFLANFNWIDSHIDGRRHQKAMEKFVILDQGNSQSQEILKLLRLGVRFPVLENCFWLAN